MKEGYIFIDIDILFDTIVKEPHAKVQCLSKGCSRCQCGWYSYDNQPATTNQPTTYMQLQKPTNNKKVYNLPKLIY